MRSSFDKTCAYQNLSSLRSLLDITNYNESRPTLFLGGIGHPRCCLLKWRVIDEKVNQLFCKKIPYQVGQAKPFFNVASSRFEKLSWIKRYLINCLCFACFMLQRSICLVQLWACFSQLQLALLSWEASFEFSWLSCCTYSCHGPKQNAKSGETTTTQKRGTFLRSNNLSIYLPEFWISVIDSWL